MSGGPVALYSECYRDPGYRMGSERRAWIEDALQTYAAGLRVFDIGCGRGETRDLAYRAGAAQWLGCEIVPELCGPGVELVSPWGRIPRPKFEGGAAPDLVLLLDVLEHVNRLRAAQLIRECYDLLPAGGGAVAVSIGLGPDVRGGVDLHCTRLDPDGWALAFEAAGFSLDQVTQGRDYPAMRFLAFRAAAR